MKNTGIGEVTFYPPYSGDVVEEYERHGALEIRFTDSTWVAFWHTPPTFEEVIEEIGDRTPEKIEGCRWGKQLALALASKFGLKGASGFTPWSVYSIDGYTELPERDDWYNPKFRTPDGVLMPEYQQKI